VFAFLEVAGGALHGAPTVVRVPLTDDGVQRLAAELERAHEVVDPPLLVWLFDVDTFEQHRGALYGYRDGAPRRALVVRHTWGPLADVVAWVCEPFVHPRRE
jgi:hypothetical protein